MYSIHWSQVAEATFAEEADFVLRKWNQNQVDKFSDLVYDFFDTISKTPKIGKYFPKQKILFCSNFKTKYIVLQSFNS